MSLFVYLAVFVIAAGSVLFGLDWMSAPMSAMPDSGVTLQTVIAPSSAPPPPVRIGGPGDTPVGNAPAPVAQKPAGETQSACNVDACASAYRSFRQSDCTYLAIGGQRRLCAK